MQHPNLIILSYHIFTEEFSDYRFSRTFEQFQHDLRKKVYDWITIDDGRKCTIEACEMMYKHNVRAKLFVCTSLVGQEGYCTWEDLKELSWHHDIENHSHVHDWHGKKDYGWQLENISTAQKLITQNIGKAPRYFVGPFNSFNKDTEKICSELGLVNVHGRINILNITK